MMDLKGYEGGNILGSARGILIAFCHMALYSLKNEESIALQEKTPEHEGEECI
jgi:hypothetical protein